jgi:hypothetical protein
MSSMQPRTLVRRLAILVALVVVLGTVISAHVMVVNASNPPGPCLASENGQIKVVNGVIYKCLVSGGAHVWVKVGIIAMQANANLMYVSAELGYGDGYYGMLRARSSGVGVQEQYALANLGNGLWALNSQANNLSVSAEFGYSGGDHGMLRARANDIEDYEKFYLYQVGSQYAFQSYTQPGTCCYVSTEIAYGGAEYAMLRARATSVGGWERYNFHFYSSFPSSLSATEAGATPSVGKAIGAPKFDSVAATCDLPSGATVSCLKLLSFA